MTRKHPKIGTLPDYKFGDKVRILHETRGFTPMTKHEATIALQVTPESDIDSARYLNELFLHQRNLGHSVETQRQTVRSAARTIIGFYHDAKILREALLGNYKVLNDVINPRLPLEGLIADIQGTDQGIDHRGILAVTRTNEVKRVAKLPENGKTKLRDLTSTGISGIETLEVPLMSIELELEGVEASVHGLRETTRNVGLEQRQRMDFWYDAVMDAKRHAVARPVVEEFFETIAA